VTDARLPDRDRTQVDALVADRYLDALLAAGEMVLPFPGSPALDADLDAILRGDLDPAAPDAPDAPDGPEVDPGAGPDRRPLIVTGAITSAALSLAGVAWVAWRASRPASRRSAMSRAARTAHARRDAAVAGFGEPA
jgi:hypothetical protein